MTATTKHTATNRAAAEISNAATYSKPRVVRSYRHVRGLFPAEREFVKRYLPQFRGMVLDIAVGAGRTTRVLSRLSQRYVGIDFSESMVEAASSAVPSASSRTHLRRLDMRDVPSALGHERFDAVLISFNGIDYIPWEDRNTLLAELRSLLTDDGVLVFSTHDLALRERESRFRIRDDLRVDGDLLLNRPLSAAARVARLPLWLLKAVPNRWRNRRLEAFRDDYAYVNDMGENYGLVTTYVSRDAQVGMLEACGYRQVEVLHPELNDQYTCFNYFACRAAKSRSKSRERSTERRSDGSPATKRWAAVRRTH